MHFVIILLKKRQHHAKVIRGIISTFKAEMNLQLTDIAEQDWKEYQSVRRPDQYDSEVHTEVEYLEDL